MEKSRQQQLIRWLKQQRLVGQRWIKLSVFFGVASTLVIILQAALIANVLQNVLIAQQGVMQNIGGFVGLLTCFISRAILLILREKAGFKAGMAIRHHLRKQVMERLSEAGPSWVASQPIGSWTTLLQEQIEAMQDYYARYLPQISLAGLTPLLILITLYPVNWAAASILLATAPLIPLFMAMVGMGAAEANRKNFQALARLGGDFLDRLRGLDTLRLFNRQATSAAAIVENSEQFRCRTMEVLRIAFLSSAVLEFFASVSIAIVAVYFGFSYLGLFHFGDYGTGVNLFAGFITLLLAPEFFQPLRDLGTFYHAKAQATGAADQLERFLSETPEFKMQQNGCCLISKLSIEIVAEDVEALTSSGESIAGPFNFTLLPKQRVALVGPSGAGKSSLLQVLAGFMSYRGSLKINGIELKELDRSNWQYLLGWVGQNPRLFATSLRENIIGNTLLTEEQLATVLRVSGVSEFLPRLPAGLETMISDDATMLSVGQAQRVAVARALVKPCRLMLLDEPTASLDSYHEQLVSQALTAASRQQSCLLITHQLEGLDDWDQIWVIEGGCIVQQGAFEQLVKAPGLFAKMWAMRQRDIIQ